GKGITDLHARTSALCEALERYSGNFHGDEPRMQASCRQLGARAIHPNSCLLFSDAQYGDRLDWNAGGSMYTAVPVPFEDAAVTDWTPVWSLTARDFKYLPTLLTSEPVDDVVLCLRPGLSVVELPAAQ